MRRDIRLLAKFLLMITGCLLLLLLLGKAVVKIVEPVFEKEHTYMTAQEAGNLVWLLAHVSQEQSPASSVTQIKGILSDMEGDWETLLPFEQAKALMECLPEAVEWIPEGYGKREKVKTADFFVWFDHARTVYDTDGRIKDTELFLLGADDQVRNSFSRFTDANVVMTDNGEFTYHTPFIASDICMYKYVEAVCFDGGLYGIRNIDSEKKKELHNAWIIEAAIDEMVFFWKDCEISISAVNRLKEYAGKKEVIGDLVFYDGMLQDAVFKEEKISGKLLRVTDSGIELENEGYFEFAAQPAFYQLFGSMMSMTKKDLRIGYGFTDFVIQDGKVAAGLTVKQEDMEYIRVLIQSDHYSGRTHDSITLTADCHCGVYGRDGLIMELTAREQFQIAADDPIFDKSERIRIEPEILTGRIYLPENERSQENSGYHGMMEISKQKDQLILINEVLLEEYLYAVVPSEMPASYPMEALKSQAVCARTYAYEKMCHAGLAEYGAHLDDSTSFQVYQNMQEQTESTRAIRETSGLTLFWENAPAEVFYYSTSCGKGTNGEVWQEGNGKKYPYLKAQDICDPQTLTAYEAQEPWYRWEYLSEQIDISAMENKLLSRFQANPSAILTINEEGNFVSKEPGKIGELQELSIVKRGEGDVASQLLISGTKNSFLIKTEYNIRYLLCDGKSPVIRQDGSKVTMGTILPSAFCDIELIKEDDRVTGYRINGGGFGHGVGMSQNGAKNMAAAGLTYEQILAFFYKGCSIENIYQ